eukprot:188568-Hanusia_phi.AAC.1
MASSTCTGFWLVAAPRMPSGAEKREQQRRSSVRREVGRERDEGGRHDEKKKSGGREGEEAMDRDSKMGKSFLTSLPRLKLVELAY